MLFNTDEFIFVFLPVTLGGYFVLYQFGRSTLLIMWLVAASLFYYGWWNPYYVALVVLSIVFNYSIGRGIVATRALGKPAVTKAIVASGIIANLGVLGYYKYANFFIDSLNSVAASDYHLAKIILPIGISFFTFQQIAFLVDSGRGETEEYDFLRYCLFVLFFPQLIAGPIVHHREMLPQFARPETFRPSFDNFTVGGTILNREYRCIPPRCSIVACCPEDASVLYVRYTDGGGHAFDLKRVKTRGVKTLGRLLTTKPVASVQGEKPEGWSARRFGRPRPPLG